MPLPGNDQIDSCCCQSAKGTRHKGDKADAQQGTEQGEYVYPGSRNGTGAQSIISMWFSSSSFFTQSS